LNHRNFEGKSPIILVLQHGRSEMFESLIENYKDEIDFSLKDSIEGNTALHHACL
jgi:ankyrin repeat protein